MGRWRSHPGISREKTMLASYPPLILVYLTTVRQFDADLCMLCSKWDECPKKTAIEIESGMLRSVINVTLIKGPYKWV